MAGIIHRHPVYDDDPHFIIEPVTRRISYEQNAQLPTLVQGDHNSEVYTFEIPRYIDRHDMMLCDVAQIHYINIEANNKMNRNSGIYEILDMQISPDDENVCVFSWTISANATAFVGALSFAIRFACSEGSKFVYVLNTSPFDSIPISTTLNNSEVVVEQYADVLEQWYMEFVHASLHGVEAIELAEQKALTKISQVGGIIVSNTEPTSTDAVAWLDTDNDILRIRRSDGTWDGLESIKGESGSIENAVSELGTSEELIVTQKKITEEINRIDADITDVREMAQVNISRIDEDIREQDVKISGIVGFADYADPAITELRTKTVAVETKNVEQDVKIENITAKTLEHDTKIMNLESANNSQNTDIANLTVKSLQIEVGQYIGTGKFGTDDPTLVLSYNLIPKVVMVRSSDGRFGTFTANNPTSTSTTTIGKVHITDSPIGAAHGSYVTTVDYKIREYGNYWCIELYADDATNQFNSSNTVYTYTIIGLPIE